MSALTDYVALEVNGEKINLYDVLGPAKVRGQLAFVKEAIDDAIIRQEAERRSLVVSDEELQLAADQFRQVHELYDVEATNAWIAARNLTFEDWESVIESNLLWHKLGEVITAGRIEQHFAENKLAFDAAEISRLVVADEDIARELRIQIVEEDADFHSLARTHSIDAETRPAGGYAGEQNRAEMEATVEAAVFGGQAGQVVGPFKMDDGWHLIKIEAVHAPELDNDLRETIKQRLFEEWLADRRRNAQIKVPLLDVIVPKNDELEDPKSVNK